MSDYNEPSRFSREDAKLMAYMEARDLKAMKNLDKAPEEPKHYRSQEVDVMTDTPSRLASKWKKDMIFLAQSENISNNAIVDDLDFTPTKIKSHVTQEMLDDYRAERQNPLVLNGQSYAYHPANLDVELEAFEPRPPAIVPADYHLAENDIARLADTIARLEGEIIHLDTVTRRETDDAYNSHKAAFVPAERTRLEGIKTRVDALKETDKAEAKAIATSLSVKYGDKTLLKTLKTNIKTKVDQLLKSMTKSGTHEVVEEGYTACLLYTSDAADE